MQLPTRFVERMNRILPEKDREKFFKTLSEEDAVRALRLNSVKASEGHLSLLAGYPLTPLSYAEDGYIFEGEHIGTTPLHHAGGIYVQDPGAMCAVCAVPIEKGSRVLDLCAAPGGKSAQLAARIGDGGLLISNEYVPSRAKILVGNFERLGIPSAMVTSLDTGELARLFSSYFDLVVADVPCSGEGMFRKSEESILHWSEENIALCQRRGEEILENAAKLVRGGGYLLYSTCTFAPEENEEQIGAFLKRHADFETVMPRECVLPVTEGGAYTEKYPELNLSHFRRFYPHKHAGEGQFFVVLKRKDVGELPTILYKDASKPLNKEESTLVSDFLKSTVGSTNGFYPRRLGDNIVLVPGGHPVIPRSVFLGGVTLGTVKGGRILPHHQFFSAYGHRFLRKVDLLEGDPRVKQYLHGEEIAAEVSSGYCAILYEGISLGGGKASSGMVKNHYPKGLRI